MFSGVKLVKSEKEKRVQYGVEFFRFESESHQDWLVMIILLRAKSDKPIPTLNEPHPLAVTNDYNRAAFAPGHN